MEGKKTVEQFMQIKKNCNLIQVYITKLQNLKLTVVLGFDD